MRAIEEIYFPGCFDRVQLANILCGLLEFAWEMVLIDIGKRVCKV
jgi:hypothetical protein